MYLRLEDILTLYINSFNTVFLDNHVGKDSCSQGAVDIFRSAPLKVHWTFRSDPPSPLLNVHTEFPSNHVSHAATQGEANAPQNVHNLTSPHPSPPNVQGTSSGAHWNMSTDPKRRKSVGVFLFPGSLQSIREMHFFYHRALSTNANLFYLR